MAGNDDDPLFHPGVPEELQEQVLNRIAMSNMEISAENHSLIESLNVLDVWATRSIRRLLAQIRDAGDTAPMVANYWVGYLTARLNFVHDVCPACGKNHAEMLDDQR